jgi:peptidoglycan/LPS O-acetylase OafA/YrhL
VFIGGVSYELYLWHGILLKIAEEATNMSESVLALWVYPTCFLLAWVTKKAWEPLQIRLRKRLSS